MNASLIRIVTLLTLLTCPALVCGLKAQELTNAKVLQMIQAELPESTIILAIEADPVGLDTSPDALIKMRENGAGKAVLDAMVTAKTKKAAPIAAAPVVTQEIPNFNEVIAVVGNQRITLMQGGQTRVSAAPYSGGRIRQTFQGASSPTRLRQGDVTFETFVMGNVRPEEVVSLAIPERRKKDRRVEISRSGGFMTFSTSAGRNTVVPLRYEKIADVAVAGMSAPKYRLVPESKLAPGEYVLILNNQFFDFGVDGN